MEIKKGSSYRGIGLLLTPLITCIRTGRTCTFCVTEHQETKKKLTQITISSFTNTVLLNF